MSIEKKRRGQYSEISVSRYIEQHEEHGGVSHRTNNIEANSIPQSIHHDVSPTITSMRSSPTVKQDNIHNVCDSGDKEGISRYNLEELE